MNKLLLLVWVFLLPISAITAQSLSYNSSSAGLSENTTSNNGTVEGDLTITIAGATFSNPAGSLSTNDFLITNLPSGLEESLNISADGTTATLVLTGQANAHQAANNVSDLTFTFQNSAFVGATASEVTNATSAASGISLAFTDNPSLSYLGDDFLEVAENDGSVTGSMTVTNTGGSFINANGSITSPEHFAISNLPSGFTAQANVSADGTIVTVTLGGKAAENQEADNVSGLIFTFTDDAFSGSILASTVFNATDKNSEVGVDFNDNPELSYASTPSLESPGNIKDAVPTGKVLTVGESPSFYMSNDGETFLVASDKTITKYTLSTPYDIESAQEDTQISGERTIVDIDFSQDESLLFVLSGVTVNQTNGDEKVNVFALTEPLDISGIDLNNPPTETGSELTLFDEEYSNKFFIGEFFGTAFDFTGLALNDNGSKLYVCFNKGGALQFSLKENYDLSEPQLELFGFGIESLEFIEFTKQGDKLYLGMEDNFVRQFELSVPFDITTATHNSLNKFALDDLPSDLVFIDGDEKFLMMTDPVFASKQSTIRAYEFLANGFREVAANDGSVEGSLDITLVNAAFSNPDGQLTADTDYTITNLPSGLVPNLAVAADGKTATLTLSGNATSSERAYDVEGLIFDFQNSAFNSLVDIEDFINASSVDSEIPVRFGLDNNLFPQAVISTPNTKGESVATYPITITFSESVSDFTQEDILIDAIEHTGSYDNEIENFAANDDNTIFTFDFKTLSISTNPVASVIYGLRLINFSTFNASGNSNVGSDTLTIKTGIYTNEAPIIESVQFEVAEFASPGTVVGKIVVSDPEGDDFTLNVTDDSSDDYNIWDAFSFIDFNESNEIIVFKSEELDLDLRSSFSFIVEADDGRLTTAKGTITLVPSTAGPLGLAEPAESLALFPNPTSDLIHVSFKNQHKPLAYSLRSLDGKELIGGKRINTSSFGIDLRSFPIGVFILQVTHQGGQVTSHKILKE